MPELTLTIADKNTSSWSMRPWILMKAKDIPFTEEKILFVSPSKKEEFLKRSPAGMVPILRDGDFTIWDSLAICEYLAELYPDRGLWPNDLQRRARARSIAAEMHSGFSSVRVTMPMNVHAKMSGFVPMPPAVPEIARISEIWETARQAAEASKAAGPFLFGDFTIADAMFAPVVSRFQTYGVDLAGAAAAYAAAMTALPAFQAWSEGARAEVS